MTPQPRGESISRRADGTLAVPSWPVVPVIEGDGIGPDVMRATRRILDAAVAAAYRGERGLAWRVIPAGETAMAAHGTPLPETTLDAIRAHVVALKGPLTTPVGGGFRSVNVTLRQTLDLYSCVRPVRHFEGVPTPMAHPGRLDVVIFRENTEDVYAGIEWEAGSAAAERAIRFFSEELGARVREGSAIGVKPMSPFASKRLVRRAIRYAIAHGRRSVTLVHKGNIMKFTEGAFMRWGYEVARTEFGDVTVTEEEVAERHGGRAPAGRIVVKDRIADNMLHQLLVYPEDYDVIATSNLNGDYLSDAAAAQVGGLGMAPGANIGDEAAVFEATHGTAPRYGNQDVANPGSLLLSGVMLLDHIGWREAGALVEAALARTIRERKVTFDLAHLLGDVKPLRTSDFAGALIENLGR